MTRDPRWLDRCLALPGAWRDEPWEGQVVAKVGPRIFAFLGGLQHAPPDGAGSLGLRCADREVADLWVERFPGSVTSMPYLGRHGWNSIALDGSVPLEEVEVLLEDSYDLVVARLPRRLRPPSRA